MFIQFRRTNKLYVASFLVISVPGGPKNFMFALVWTQVGWTICSNVRSWFNKDLFTINNHCETQNVNALNCFQNLIVMYYVTIIHLVKFMVFPWTHKHTPLWWSTARTLCSMIRIVTTRVACYSPVESDSQTHAAMADANELNWS